MLASMLAVIAGMLVAAADAAVGSDVAALLQTERQVLMGPPEKDFMKLEVPKQAAPFRAGENLEVVLLEGTQISKWIPCTVVHQDGQNDTYTIHVTEEQRDVSGIPAIALRRPPPPLDLDKNIADGVLLFWAVNGEKYTIDLVKQNIEHLRQTYKGPADVFLFHYDGEQDAWKNSDEAWYKAHVKFSEKKAWRIKRNHAIGFPPQLFLAQEILPTVIEKGQYRWIWLLDEAIDLRSTDMTQLFEDASATKSMIAAPAVVLGNHSSGLLARADYHGCDPKYTACKVHAANPECSYRYVNFIDMAFPLIHPQALMEMYRSCSRCLEAIDHVWCARSARLLRKPEGEACAILDRVTVAHSNALTLKETNMQVLLKKSDAQTSGKQDWVDGDAIKTLKCIPDESASPDESADEDESESMS